MEIRFPTSLVGLKLEEVWRKTNFEIPKCDSHVFGPPGAKQVSSELPNACRTRFQGRFVKRFEGGSDLGAWWSFNGGRKGEEEAGCCKERGGTNFSLSSHSLNTPIFE